METQRPDSPDAASTDAEVFLPALSADPAAEPQPRKRIGRFEGHLPDRVDALDPRDPDTAFTATRTLRHDGWTPDKMHRFLERFAECGVVVEACEAVGMSARSAYNLRDRDPLFAAGWEAATVIARPRLADEAFSRSMNGVVERIYKDGEIVAERHRYDNKLTMSVLGRLDARIDRAEAMGAPHLALVGRWDEYLAALAEDRRADGLALLAPPAPAAGEEGGGDSHDRELRELHPGWEDPEMDELDDGDPDRHLVWEGHGVFWTNYPPPPDFDGEEEGSYGAITYRRTLSPEEQAVIDADVGAVRSARLAEAEAQRRAYFGFDDPDDDGSDGEGDGAGDSGAS